MLLFPRILATLPIIATASGCVSLPPNLAEKRDVSIHIEDSRPIYIAYARIYRDVSDTIVKGEARHPVRKQFGIFNGHIDIDVAMPNGESVKMQEVALVRKRVPKKRGRRASFVAKLPVDPPKGTVIHIAYHDGTHDVRRGPD